MLMGIAILVATGAPAVTRDPQTCPPERAIYRFESEDGRFEFKMVPARNYASMASDLYLHLTTPQRGYWFTFSVSNGYGGTSLIPVSDPTAPSARPDGPRELLAEESAFDLLAPSLRFYALDASLSFLVDPPVSGGQAPDYIMAPELGLALWYDAAALSGDPDASRDPMERGMFRLAECLVAPPDPAYP